jgi:hypothetical protein
MELNLRLSTKCTGTPLWKDMHCQFLRIKKNRQKYYFDLESFPKSIVSSFHDARITSCLCQENVLILASHPVWWTVCRNVHCFWPSAVHLLTNTCEFRNNSLLWGCMAKCGAVCLLVPYLQLDVSVL